MQISQYIAKNEVLLYALSDGAKLFLFLFSAQSLSDEVSLESSEGDKLGTDQKLRGEGGGDRGGGGLREGRDYHQHQAEAQEKQHLL